MDNYGQLTTGTHSHGGPNRFKLDTLKVSMKEFNVDFDNREVLAEARSDWQSAISKGAKKHEANKSRFLMPKPSVRQGNPVQTQPPLSLACVPAPTATGPVMQKSF